MDHIGGIVRRRVPRLLGFVQVAADDFAELIAVSALSGVMNRSNDRRTRVGRGIRSSITSE